ncbi:MAG: hypothetical protein ABI639_13655 [Thermoanaerobaculia bacterium]
MTRQRASFVVMILVASLAGGCLGGSRPDKPRGSALWVSRDSGDLDAATQSRLAALGVKEIYLDAAELTFDGGVHLRKIKAPSIPRGTPTTLVIYGIWSPGDRPPEQLATGLASELSSLRIDAEQRGLKVNGYHLEVRPGTDLESMSKTLPRVRSRLGGQLLLSAGLTRGELEGRGAQTIANVVDYVVSSLYGQRPGEGEDSAAWDFEAVEAHLRQLEHLHKPYVVGAITLGTATWRGHDGSAKATSTMLSLGDLVSNRSFELKGGFSLQAIDRQVWEFAALGPVKVGDWNVAKGESIRLVRTATPLMEELLRRVGASESPLHIGELFFRLPQAGERLSLSVDNLVDVLSPAAATPQLELAVEKIATSASTWKVRVKIANRSSESTDLAFIDSNYVELLARGATIGEIELGDFHRFDLLVDGEKGTIRSIRQANTVRLNLPLLEENHEAASGAIELKLTQRTPEISISASFLLTDGRTLTIAPQIWQFDKK